MKLSILIRNLNEAEALRHALKAVRRQKPAFDYEIIVLDNESTDHSREIASEYGCIVKTLKRDEFTYGHALNTGLSYTSGEIVLLLSSHSILINEHFLTNLVGYFEDPKVGAVRCTRLSNRKQLFASFDQPVKVDAGKKEIGKILREDWDLLLYATCSAIRRNVWEKIPFHKTIESNEEKLWNLQMLKAGYQSLAMTSCYFMYVKDRDLRQSLNFDYVMTLSKARIAKDTVTEFTSLKEQLIGAAMRPWNEIKKLPKRIRFAFKLHKIRKIEQIDW